MPYLKEVVGALGLLGALVLIALALRPELTRGRRGRILAFVALFALPVLATGFGVSAHMEASKSTRFCLSCHEMEPYGRSLLYEDDSHLPAGHYQNARVDREHACFDCHTEYTMFGDVTSKFRGLRHVWVHYFGDIPPPGEIELYEPYSPRECLHCHGNARSFLEGGLHADIIGELRSGEMVCFDCHESVHAVGEDDLPIWHPPPEIEDPVTAVLPPEALGMEPGDDGGAETQDGGEPAGSGETTEAGGTAQEVES